MLSNEDKDSIQQRGEITRQIEFNDPARSSLLKGTLRILKTENPQTYNFVEVGEWVDHGRNENSPQAHNQEFRDSLVYDENGNTLSRRAYGKEDGSFHLNEEWTSEMIDGHFVQHMKVYDHGVLVAEYSRDVVNYLEPKSDLQKEKIPFGTDKGYYPDGKLAYVRNYDDNGKLVREQTYDH